MLVWLVVVLSFVTAYVVLAIWERPSVAIAVVVPLSWLIPAWLSIDVGTEKLDVKTAVTIASLCLYSFLPRATFPWRLIPSDYAALALVAVHLSSDAYNSGIQAWSIAIAYVEWVVPYLAGRLAFQNRENIRWIWPTVALVAIVLAVAAIFEAWAGFNPYEVVFGERPLEGTARNAMRWGYRRAYSTCLHPLYLGVLLCWLSGFLLYPAWRGLTGRSHIAWLGMPVLGILAPLATGSRGPFLATFVVIIASIFCGWKKLRYGIAIVTLTLMVGFAVVQEPLFDVLDRWSGETNQGRLLKEIELNNQVEKFSSARARLTLFKIFWTPLKRAGLLGYGTEALSTFPPNVPTGADEVEAMRDIWSVDNTYILVTLRFGYLGLISFVLLATTSLVQLVVVADADRKSSLGHFVAPFFGSLVASLALIFAVWMPAEIGFPLLWSFGASGGLFYEYLQSRNRKSIGASF